MCFPSPEPLATATCKKHKCEPDTPVRIFCLHKGFRQYDLTENFTKASLVTIALSHLFRQNIREVLIDKIEKIGYINCRTSKGTGICRNPWGFAPGWFFFTFIGFRPSMFETSLVYQFTTNKRGIPPGCFLNCREATQQFFILNSSLLIDEKTSRMRIREVFAITGRYTSARTAVPERTSGE